MQLILEPGFSTAGSITQQAGRGVGMDVVATEIKRLGGALHMETKRGRGHASSPSACRSRWRSATRWWCAPTRSTTRCRCRRWRACCACPRPRSRRTWGATPRPSSYGGQKYRFQHLATFVGLEPSPLPEQDVTIPVVLVRAGEHSTGLVADELVGSREIVVKSVGPQISGIRGISGATILGDGRIVIILDIGALVRGEWRARAQAPAVAARAAATAAPSPWWSTTRSPCAA